MALRKTLLPRSGYPEGFTGLQQRLVLHILTHQPFDIIDLLLAKIEDVITDGMGVLDSYLMATGSAIFVHGLCQMRGLLLPTMML
jgi:hypothetical protein